MTLYFTCVSAGTAVVHVTVAEVAVVVELTALIQVCATELGTKNEIAMSVRSSDDPLCSLPIYLYRNAPGELPRDAFHPLRLLMNDRRGWHASRQSFVFLSAYFC